MSAVERGSRWLTAQGRVAHIATGGPVNSFYNPRVFCGFLMYGAVVAPEDRETCKACARKAEK